MIVNRYGKTQEHRNKISIALTGKPKPWLQKEKIKKICPCGTAFELTPGQVRDGHGKYHARACYYKYRVNFDVSKMSHTLKGVKHWNYKGDAAKYKALHLRVNEQRGKTKICEECNSDYYVEWANLTGQYQDVNDYKSLCRKCHKKYDLSRKDGDAKA